MPNEEPLDRSEQAIKDAKTAAADAKDMMSPPTEDSDSDSDSEQDQDHSAPE